MPTITLNRAVFENIVGKKLADGKLKDRISMLGTDLESVDRDSIVVEIFPNRPDMLSEQGFGRAFASFIGVKKGLREYKVSRSGQKVIVDKSVKDVRPYTACAIVKGLKFDDEKIREVIQIQEKLHISYGRDRKKCAVGIYPCENIKYPIHYKAMDPKKIVFRPLEYPKELNGLQILTKHPKGRAYAHLLEGHDKFPIFEDSDGKILSMPPIINSHGMGKIDANTKEVFIEFSGHDYNVLSKGLNILLCSLAEMGGEICSMELEYDKKITSPDLSPEEMKIDISYVNKVLGLELKEKEMAELLERMGYGYRKGKVLVPAYRADILHQIDLVEDIAIAYGYENFEAVIPNVATTGEEDKFEVFKSAVADILIGLGLQEVSTYHITNDINQSTKMNFQAKCVELANALTTEYNVLRSWVVPDIMEVLQRNKHNEHPQNIFCIGNIFRKSKSKEYNDKNQGSLVDEAIRLGVGLCSETVDFTIIKQHLDYLFRMLDIKYEIKEAEHPSFIPGRVGRVYVNGKGVAYIGEIAPSVLVNWDLEFPVSVFELNLTDLFDMIKEIEVK